MSDSDLSSKYILQTAGFDGKLPWQNYTDYFKCVAAKGEDFAPCKQFKRAYHSLCPSECNQSPCYSCSNDVSKWDEQRDNGTFPASLEP
ncbi:cytochrome c oxidase subunit VIb [Pisolithus sp. B1]|nr:cytochrome c oxidase subunit VIb [Pisolithus sp. B1]